LAKIKIKSCFPLGDIRSGSSFRLNPQGQRSKTSIPTLAKKPPRLRPTRCPIQPVFPRGGNLPARQLEKIHHSSGLGMQPLEALTYALQAKTTRTWPWESRSGEVMKESAMGNDGNGDVLEKLPGLFLKKTMGI
jgi:hypothetical protein